MLAARWRSGSGAAVAVLLSAVVVLPLPVTHPLLDPEWSWTQVVGTPAPPALGGATFAFDNRTDRFLLFGGDMGEPTNATWSFDPVNGTWTELTTAVAPPPRADAALVYDPSGNEFLLFGGWDEYPNGTYYRYNDTWAFSPATSAWTELATHGAPSPRSDVATDFDSGLDRWVVFGGYSGSAYLGDLWQFDPVNLSWEPLLGACSPPTLPGPAGPGPRADGRLSYDSVDKLSVLFGGNDFSGPGFTFHHLNDTWELRLPDGCWTPVLGSNHPSARDYPAQGFDAAHDLVFLFGGFGNRKYLGDSWVFYPPTGTWTQLSVTTAPAGRFAGVGAFDTVDERFVIASGAGHGGGLNDTWVLSETTGGRPGVTEAVELAALLAVPVAALLAVELYRLRRPPPR